ncbi:hypothetical protein DPMN_025772, partial [Dreissena polymorpha]
WGPKPREGSPLDGRHLPTWRSEPTTRSWAASPSNASRFTGTRPAHTIRALTRDVINQRYARRLQVLAD